MTFEQEALVDPKVLHLLPVDIRRGAKLVLMQAFIGLSLGVAIGTLLVLFEGSTL